MITRDLIIVIGASCYYKIIGAFEFSATNLSKSNMLVQICFCVLVLLHQVLPAVPQESILIGSVAVLFIAFWLAMAMGAGLVAATQIDPASLAAAGKAGRAAGALAAAPATGWPFFLGIGFA